MEDVKQFGASILKDEGQPTDTETGFESINYSDKEIEEMRNDLKSTYSGKVKDKVNIDTISGIRSSEHIDENEDDRSISDIVNSKKKRKMTKSGIVMLTDILGRDPSPEDIEPLFDYFDSLTNKNDIYELDLPQAKTILGSDISSKVEEIADRNEVSLYEAIIKLLVQLYDSYHVVVEYNNDLDEIFSVVNSLRAFTGSLGCGYTDEDTLMSQYEKISEATENLKHMDDRNHRLTNSYKVTDFDILLLDELKECLANATNFNKLINKINNISPKKFRKDTKNKDEIRQYIGNWITDLKNDTETLYTLPINDYLSADESVTEMISYISGFIMLQDLHEEYDNIDPSEQVSDINQYFVDNGLVNKKKLNNYEESATIFLYLLSKTFKKKKIKTDSDRRILSYTLDIVSKVSIPEYAMAVMKVINIIGDKFDMATYDYIKED